MFHVPEHPAEGLEKGVVGMCSQFQFIDVHLTKCLLSQKNIISKFSNPKVKYKYQVEFENILKFSLFLHSIYGIKFSSKQWQFLVQ